MTKRIAEFDLWRPGYGGAVVSILLPGTTTLAAVYTDEGLTQAAPNPQTLSAMESAGGTRYGKFAASLYTSSSYYLSIDGIEDSGIIRDAISSLDGEDASAALVTPANSTYAVPLADLVAHEVNVANFGSWVAGGGGVAATNTTTLNLAIAALASGGIVKIPVGLYNVNAIDIPQSVVLQGQGVDATTLKSVLGAESFTIEGDFAGFKNLTIDGSTLSAGSIGVKSVGHNSVIFDNVKIERFETGMYFSGGSAFAWKDLTIINVDTAAKLWGETTIFEDLMWTGGLVSTATVLGLNIGYKDHMCQNITFVGVGFESNVGQALLINGAQNVKTMGCWGDNNTALCKIQDDATVLTPSTAYQNQSIIFQWLGGRLNGGTFEVTGTAQDVFLKDVNLTAVQFIMTTPLQNYLILENCYEQGVTITGETTRLIRSTTSHDGTSLGLTTANVATKAWAITLKPGQEVYLVGKVIGKGRNVAQRGIYHIAAGAYQVGAALAYKTQTTNFTPGAIVTGASSGATARIQADADGGTTGTLTITDISGTFVNNEIITDNNGTPGSATVNGAITTSSSVVDGIGVTSIRGAYETNANWNALFVANGPDIELQVTGDTTQTVEWTVHVDVVST